MSNWLNIWGSEVFFQIPTNFRFYVELVFQNATGEIRYLAYLNTFDILYVKTTTFKTIIIIATKIEELEGRKIFNTSIIFLLLPFFAKIADLGKILEYSKTLASFAFLVVNCCFNLIIQNTERNIARPWLIKFLLLHICRTCCHKHFVWNSFQTKV